MSRVSLLALAFFFACDNEATDGPTPTPSADAADGDTRSTTDVPPDRPDLTSGPTCGAASDCPKLVCYCLRGAGDFPSPVNSRRCIDGRRQGASESCADVCAGFGMTWNGQSETIPNRPAPDTSSPSDTSSGGNSCQWAFDDECDDAEYGGSGACTPASDEADCT